MKQIKNKRLYYTMTAVAGFLLLFQANTAAGQVSGKTSTRTAPLPSTTQTAPLPSTTTTIPLPSDAVMEYQKVDKPPVKKLEGIPDWDLDCDHIRNLEFIITGKKADPLNIVPNRFNGFKFKLALMNLGKQHGARDIPIKITVLNISNNTLIKQENRTISSQNIRTDYWELTPDIKINFRLGSGTAENLGDVKLIVDVDPNNTFGEAQSDRGNNRVTAHW